MAIREKAVVLIDGPALVHRWYHRWHYATRNGSTAVDLTRFAVRNTRYTIATAHSFDPSHLAQYLLSPQLEYAYTPKHNKLVICFDHGDGGRRAMYAEYKQNRKNVVHAPELLTMEKVAKRVFAEEPADTLVIVPDFDARLRNIDAEADDMIASLASYTQERKIPTVVMSHDFDLYQLVDNANRSYHYDLRTRRLVSDKSVVERIGVQPKLVRDYKALAGDASDNIPGIKGIGKVRARQLLKKYGDLDGVLSKGVQRQGGHVGDLLRSGAKNALLSRQLVDFRMCHKLVRACQSFIDA